MLYLVHPAAMRSPISSELRAMAPTFENPSSSSRIPPSSAPKPVYGIHSSSSKSSGTKSWVDPASLPNCGDISRITGNVSDDIKQLVLNTFYAYGGGDEDCFGHHVIHDVEFKDMNVDEREKNGRMESTTVAEVTVAKNMLNGAGMLHGGCVAFLVDNCCSTPLIVLGLIQNVNGVGVTQAMNVSFHSPAAQGTRLQIVSTSVALGGRIMSARCEIINKKTGRIVASAYLNKMQPVVSKM